MEWIDVEKRMPERGDEVLIIDEDKMIYHAYWDFFHSNSGDWQDVAHKFIIDKVTHWMLLPPLPEDKDADI